MVLQLNSDQLALVAPTPLTSPALQNDVRVLFLANTTRSGETVTHRAGRIGRVRQPHVNAVTNARQDGTLDNIDRAHVTDERRNYNGTVVSLALVNPPVIRGMRIVDVDEAQYGESAVGNVGTVTATGAQYVQYRDPNGRLRTSYKWVLSADNEIELPEKSDIPEDLRISQWWVNRIQEIARDEGKKRRWCSELEEVLNRVLEPIKAGGYKIVEVSDTDQPGSEVVAYEIWDGDGQFAASFREKEEAEKYRDEKNKKLPPVFKATLD